MPTLAVTMLGLDMTSASPISNSAGPSGRAPRTRGGRRVQRRKAANRNITAVDANPFVGIEVRKADGSHRDEGWLAHDTCNGNAWRGPANYLDTTGADALFFQETRVPDGQRMQEVEQSARISQLVGTRAESAQQFVRRWGSHRLRRRWTTSPAWCLPDPGFEGSAMRARVASMRAAAILLQLWGLRRPAIFDSSTPSLAYSGRYEAHGYWQAT